MAISVFPIASSSAPVPSQFPATAAGTFTIPSLAAGIYEITTDTIQSSFTIAFKTSEGFIFEGTVRGGKGFVSVPKAATSIIIPSGLTYPFLINYVLASYTQTAAPTSVSWTWPATGDSGLNFVGTLSGTYPSGATGYSIYWTDGTNQAVSNINSPSASITPYAVVNSAGVSRNFIVAAKDANGVYGTATAVTSTGNSNAQNIAATFTASGTWTAPAGVSSVRYLVVGGGGGGGPASYNGGGGGAGGVRTATSLAVTGSTSYSVIVGAGGSNNYNGVASSFNGISASGGGRGGHYQGARNGGSGGSGGGGAAALGTGGAGNAGGYSPVEGYAGGAAQNVDSGQAGTGGGGGAGAVGQVGSSTAGNGGVGILSDISGSSTYYGGGGGGGKKSNNPGTGGLGGGGNGGSYDGNNFGVGGTANTGGGAGGRSPANGGGSGIVILKYSG